MREQQTKGKAGRDAAIRSRAREHFLKALSAASSVTAAATAAGVSRMTVYRWQAADPAFAEAWRDAYEAGSDRIEDELGFTRFCGHCYAAEAADWNAAAFCSGVR